MSIKGMMQTVLVTELKQIQPDISDDALKHVMVSFSHIWDERDALAAKLSMVIAAWNGYNYDTINAEINKTPLQCLAEIKAEAVESAIKNCAVVTVFQTDTISVRGLLTYAAKIRKGEL